MSEFPSEIPMGAESVIQISAAKYSQKILFFYSDVALIYYTYHELGEIERMLSAITQNMQMYVNQDKLYVNGSIVPLSITNTALQFEKEDKTKPVINFELENSSDFKLILNSVNEIKLHAEFETVTYPITSHWILPGEVFHVESIQQVDINGNRVVFSSSIGNKIGGEEIILFKFNSL